MSYAIGDKIFRVGYEASFYSGKFRKFFKALVMPQWQPGMVSVRFVHEGIAMTAIVPADSVNPLN